MFYDNFIALCSQKGVTPSAVMKSIGLNKSSATYWKKGSMPTSSTIQKLADYFGVSCGYLLGKRGVEEYYKEFEKTKSGDFSTFFDSEDIVISKQEAMRFTNYLFQNAGAEQASEAKQSLAINMEKLMSAFEQLTVEGQQKAIERVEELTEIPRYRLQKSLQSTLDSTDSKDIPIPERPTGEAQKKD